MSKVKTEGGLQKEFRTGQHHLTVLGSPSASPLPVWTQD